MSINIEKNIKDLEYNTYLNYFNIITLFIGTTYITLIIGTANQIKWTVSLVFSTAIFVLLFLILIWLLFYSKLTNIKEKIKSLKA